MMTPKRFAFLSRRSGTVATNRLNPLLRRLLLTHTQVSLEYEGIPLLRRLLHLTFMLAHVCTEEHRIHNLLPIYKRSRRSNESSNAIKLSTILLQSGSTFSAAYSASRARRKLTGFRVAAIRCATRAAGTRVSISRLGFRFLAHKFAIDFKGDR